MKILPFLLVIALLGLSSFGPSAELQKLEYEIIVFDRSIGTFTATRTELNGRSEYQLETAVSTRFITRIDFRFAMQSSYQNSRLISADMKDWMNNKLRSSSSVRFDGFKYVINTKNKTETYQNGTVDYSSALLYFEEPVGRTFLFSENYGIDLPIKKVGSHKYMITLPNGDRNYYQYKNGLVSEVEFDKKLINVRMHARI